MLNLVYCMKEKFGSKTNVKYSFLDVRWAPYESNRKKICYYKMFR